MSTRTIRIGNGQGFWGDSIDAPVELFKIGNLDYLTLDYLAEVTMSIMQRQKLKNPETGYAHDFIDFVERIFPYREELGTRIISNAGGVNPKSCSRQLIQMARERNQRMKIGIIEGDNIFDHIDELQSKGVDFKNMDTGEQELLSYEEVLIKLKK